jgi:FkbM family methyltransferase
VVSERTRNTAIRILSIAILACEGVALGGIAWILSRSECSLTGSFSDLKRDEKYFRSRVNLQATEDGLDLWKTPEGPLWTVHGDTMLPFLMSEQARDIYEPKGHEVRQGDIVLDCGANIGVYTRKALSRGASLVVAIEPAPQTLAALRRNFDKEIQEGRVIVYPKGVWDHNAELDLSINQTNQAANSLIYQAQSSVRIPLTTIDNIVAELKLTRVDFIKMDIEGAEKPAISGGKSTIRRFRPRMSLSTEHLPDDSTAIPALVNSIAPNYVHTGCDCGWVGWRIKAAVLAFDPR